MRDGARGNTYFGIADMMGDDGREKSINIQRAIVILHVLTP